ncbi:Ribose/xylose/arabinose/galactoside ABC-type transport system, permease component [Glycomyces sambucus]|uniref:Ribose/xylose/arabinose/galactoside ABC-type transport system, permease component n=1 Tax=Glycomyces sambucus TaxID=380244 RepID=A0A1G9H0E1_9ACTN|nr:hypothetical protein [Glycomyces sambucus]SDL06367.1 Ribose/xylose/arabinose/galactoside ABC-type transport system, permease component [Glycomyces sambucus]
MTYVPPDRDDQALDQTQRLDIASPGLPAIGNGVDNMSAQPVDPFAGRPAVTVGYAEAAPPARDRVVFQFVWEAILLLLTLNALFLVYQRREEILGGAVTFDAVEGQLAALTPLLLLATGFALTLRLGAVNLAVPAMPGLVIALPELFVGDNPLVGLAYTAGAAAVLAVLFTILTVVLRIPAWLAGVASLVVIAGSFAALGKLSGAVGADGAGTWTDPGALWLFLGAAALSIAGGLLGLVPAVRDRFSRVKGAADGTGDREGGSVAVLLGGTFLALLLGALAGFLPAVFALETGVAGMFQASPDALVLGPQVLIVVFLAGTSPWGRRGGVFGTVLAAVAVWSLSLVWASLDERFMEWTGAVYAGLLLLGLFVSFGLDRLGRPKEYADVESDTAEMSPYDNDGTGLFEPTLPDATTAAR